MVPQLVAGKRLGSPKVREYMRISRISQDIQIVPFNNDIDTLHRAVMERVFLVKEKGQFVSPPRPTKNTFEARLSPSFDILKQFLPSTAPLNYQATLGTFAGRKKKVYENAYQNIVGGHNSIRDDALVNVFVKYEKTDRTSKIDPVPRVISPRSPEFNLRLAKYLRPIEEKIFDALGELFGTKTVMKGVTVEDTAHYLQQKWDMYKNPVAVGLDASRFDQHVSIDALRFEHKVYLQCMKSTKHKNGLANLLQYQLRNRCRGDTADGWLKYTTEGTRMSGDMNTSLGNCILMCLMIHAYAKHVGVDLQLANNGDDCVVFMEKRDLEKFSKPLDTWFREMGFNMVVEEPCMRFEHIEFCQTRPVFDGIKWVMCRNPTTATTKDSVLLKHPNNLSPGFIKQWYDAVGTGGLSLAGGLPVLQEFYSMMQRSGARLRRNRRNKLVSMSSVEMLPWYMRESAIYGKRGYATVTPEARESFHAAFGITPDHQECIEDHYRTMSLTTDPVQGWQPCTVPTFL